MKKNAAITICSKNYFSFAKTLSDSYLKHHPDNDFIIILVDKRDGLIPERLDNGAEVLELTAIRIPDLSRFIYRYTIMELNTAVKPFALASLFEQRGYATLLYIDPDIWIFRPMTELYSALNQFSIVLIPHMRRPYYDNCDPSELSILQSGTYNLGFIGLRNGESSRQLLSWWMTKLYKDCVVNIPVGLFVDQKWMDLIPGFFPDHKIFANPTYNVAYWNLHERNLYISNGVYFIGAEPLTFFHFSGYLPIAPQQLSKHQNRHQLSTNTALRSLTTLYAEELFKNGYEDNSNWPYAFETLPNGVKIPIPLIRDIMQWAVRNNVPTPNPLQQATEYCNFLLSYGQVPDYPNIPLLFCFILKRRPDVASTYPSAWHNSQDAGFRGWLMHSGIHEEQIDSLLPFEKSTNPIVNYVADTFERLRQNSRQDVFKHYKHWWLKKDEFDAFTLWIEIYGAHELGLSPQHSVQMNKAFDGIYKILSIYFLRGDLQLTFPILGLSDQQLAFTNWLRLNRYNLNLSEDEIALFIEYANNASDLIEGMRFLYTHCNEVMCQTPTVYNIEKRKYQLHSTISSAKILEWLDAESAISPADHFIANFGTHTDIIQHFEKVSIKGLDAKKNYQFFKRLRQEMNERASTPLRVNLAGFFNVPSGMGESARSMALILKHAAINFRSCTLPDPRGIMTDFPQTPAIFGWPYSGASHSITVANADSKSMVQTCLPNNYWSTKNIGYWVWETEALPFRFHDADELYDEIWTPSNYSAAAIRCVTTRKVRILPYALNLSVLETVQPNRKRFGLPEDTMLFGFIFDVYSVLERKNVTGLIDAFQTAFQNQDNCYLVLKVNGNTSIAAYEYELALSRINSNRVIIIDNIFSRLETYEFIKSLDVYVSLHRAEGFGLTCAEAMALGVPVIATGYSGNLQFMNEENSLLVPTKVIETDRPYGPYPAGTRWGAPNLEAAVDLMRKALDPEMRLEVALRGQHFVVKTLSPGVISGMAMKLISGL